MCVLKFVVKSSNARRTVLPYSRSGGGLAFFFRRVCVPVVFMHLFCSSKRLNTATRRVEDVKEDIALPRKGRKS